MFFGTTYYKFVYRKFNFVGAALNFWENLLVFRTITLNNSLIYKIGQP